VDVKVTKGAELPDFYNRWNVELDDALGGPIAGAATPAEEFPPIG